MGDETLIQKIKDVIYKIVLPIYLWSIGCKTLNEYIENIEKDYQAEKDYVDNFIK